MPKKKVNPNRQPTTQADVERAFRAGYEEGYKDSAIMWNTVLCDKESAGNETMQRVYDELCYLAESVNKGDTTLGELNHALVCESKIRITKH